VTPIENPKSQIGNPAELLPLSLLNDFLYCSRRAALKVVEGWRASNAHTARGDIVHEHADLPGYEVAKGVTLLRALPIWSERLGLSGKCDIVEQRTNGSLCPVEYKKGKRRQWVNDDVQLCAQALCLEEMFNISIPQGAIFHAESKRRREVEFTPELRGQTEETAARLHGLLASEQVPAAVFKPACEECSLFSVCLPKATCADSRAERLTRALYKTD
jgi:CRISPR-associated exonuclease Cas4